MGFMLGVFITYSIIITLLFILTIIYVVAKENDDIMDSIVGRHCNTYTMDAEKETETVIGFKLD